MSNPLDPVGRQHAIVLLSLEMYGPCINIIGEKDGDPVICSHPLCLHGPCSLCACHEFVAATDEGKREVEIAQAMAKNETAAYLMVDVPAPETPPVETPLAESDQ